MPEQFFDDNQGESQEIEKIKLGDDEYSQEELQRLVGLGKIGLEAEEKYKTKIDKVWPKYQQVINEKKALEDRYRSEDEARQRAAQAVTNPNRQMTQEEMRAEAIKQAEELGIGPQSIRKTVMEVIQGQQLLTDINGVIDEMTGEGLPTTNVEDLIAHMQETGIRNPQKAYKDMFEKEWIANQTGKLSQIKQSGMATISASSAGGKHPAPLKITGDNFDKLFAAALSGEAA